MSWDKFTQELLRRFGDSEAWKLKSVVVRHEIQVITTSAIHTDIDTKATNSVPLPLAVRKPIPPPVLVPLSSLPSLPTPITPPTPATPPTLATVTSPLLSTSRPYIPQFQPPFLPLLQRLVSVAAADHTKLVVSTPPTTAMMTSPLLSASPVNLQFQSPFVFIAAMFSFRCPPVHTYGSFPSSPYSSPSSLVQCAGYYLKA